MFVSKNFQHRENGDDIQIIGTISHDMNRRANENIHHYSGAWKNNRKLNRVDEEAQVHNVNNMKEICKEFCANSTVHGVRYLTEPKRHCLERLWWMVAITISIVASFYSITSIWLKWTHNPVTVNFNDRTTSISAIPFPAMTLCTTQKYTKQKINMIKIDLVLKAMRYNQSLFSLFTPEEAHQLNAMLQTCGVPYDNFGKDVFVPSRPTIYEAIKNITSDRDSIILSVSWGGDKLYNAFKPVFTEDGLCYTFNSLNSKEIFSDITTTDLLTVNGNPSGLNWDIHDGYQENIDGALYPLRTFGSGIRESLTVFLGMLLDNTHHLCTGYAPGFRLSMHAPDDLPRMPNDFIHIPPEQNVFISIKPDVITTSDALRAYGSQKRGCYFKSERQLAFFKHYSQQKCEMECLSNYTLHQCGCVQFALPRVNSTQVCTMVDMQCYFNAQYRFGVDLVVQECNCLPDCTSISYDVEISQAQSSYSEDDTFEKDYKGKGFQARTILFLSFKENYFLALNRGASSTMPEFISSCGGLLGLFMGISVLSVIELFYFITLRLCCKMRRQETIPIDGESWATRHHFATTVANYKERRHIPILK